MKIIVNNDCYVQVRDILFLAKIYNSKVFMNKYLELINNGKVDVDFIKVTSNKLKEALENGAIINFDDFRDSSITALGSYLVTMYTGVCNNDKEKVYVEHKADAIRDIIAFKNGKLPYAIPLIPNGKERYEDSNLKVVCESTIFDNYYIIKKVDGNKINNISYQDFINSVIDKIKEKRGSIIKGRIIDKGDYLVLCLEEEIVKKESYFKRFKKVFKKET